MPETRVLVDTMKRIALEAAVDTFGTGYCMAPQVHMFYEPEDEYVGYVSCRPYYRGQDAQTAIEHLGVIAAAMCATRLLVVWEESDLRTSLYGPANEHPNGVALLEVSLTDHELSWRPFRYLNGYGQAPGMNANFDISWGEPSVQSNVTLMPVVRNLMQAWRLQFIGKHGPAWTEDTLNAASAAGYDIRVAHAGGSASGTSG